MLNGQYVPENGWFDLTERPEGLSKVTHEKLQQMQMDFRREAKKYKDPEVRKNNQVNYEKLKEYSAQLQQIIFAYWPHEMLFR